MSEPTVLSRWSDFYVIVGSSAAAKAVYVRATSHGKRALCLGGAKNILIVAPDADEELTIKAVVDSFTGCAGQRCMAGSLLVAVDGAGQLIPKIADAAARLKLGPEMGALIDRSAIPIRSRASTSRLVPSISVASARWLCVAAGSNSKISRIWPSS